MNELISVVFGGTSGAFVAWVGREWISTRLRKSIEHEYSVQLEKLKTELIDRQNQGLTKWKLKYEACMQALDLADAALSNMDISGIPENLMVKEDIRTEDVRDCINKLACACDDSSVIELFKKIIMGNGLTLDIIVDLRNEVRAELNFSKKAIDLDRETAYIVRVGPNV